MKFNVKLIDADYSRTRDFETRTHTEDNINITLTLKFSCSPTLMDNKLSERFTEYIITWLDRWGRPSPEIMDILLERARDEVEEELTPQRRR